MSAPDDGGAGRDPHPDRTAHNDASSHQPDQDTPVDPRSVAADEHGVRALRTLARELGMVSLAESIEDLFGGAA